MFYVVRSIAVSSAECERGASAMNLTVTDIRAAWHVNTITNLMFLKLVGPSLAKYEPALYVRSWLPKDDMAH
jgi:hypothetical protein